MADHVSAKTRSAIMAAVKSANTTPEMTLRRLLHCLGYRYRLHDATLPGRPDLVFRSRRKIILVHGCFWHGHNGCRYSKLPKSRLDYWCAKREANLARDARNLRQLRRLGWSCLVVWQCELKCPERVLRRVTGFLDRVG